MPTTLYNVNTRDERGNPHLISGKILDWKYFEITESSFFFPTLNPKFTGYGADGVKYINGNQIATNLASWATETPHIHRGSAVKMPERFFVISTEREITIINSRSGNVWMRFIVHPLPSITTAVSAVPLYAPPPYGGGPIESPGVVHPRLFTAFADGVLAVLNSNTVLSIDSGFSGYQDYLDNYANSLTFIDFINDKVTSYAGGDPFTLPQVVIRYADNKIVNRNKLEGSTVIVLPLESPVGKESVRHPFFQADNWPAKGRASHGIFSYSIDENPYFILLRSFGITVLSRETRKHHLNIPGQVIKAVVNKKDGHLYFVYNQGNVSYLALWADWWKDLPKNTVPYKILMLTSDPQKTVVATDLVLLRNSLYISTNRGMIEATLDLSDQRMLFSSNNSGVSKTYTIDSTDSGIKKMTIDPTTGLLGIITTDAVHELNAINGRTVRRTDAADFGFSRLDRIVGVGQ
ncbi:hypothetical protein LCGC14_0147480 [marine sediment metagenome]|uniref:Uncharacterized protein n=1 Tax=marine sediment metagenome TaxID=412755 RepID=A0A0F9XHQ4_9ZZZZ